MSCEPERHTEGRTYLSPGRQRCKFYKLFGEKAHVQIRNGGKLDCRDVAHREDESTCEALWQCHISRDEEKLAHLASVNTKDTGL